LPDSNFIFFVATKKTEAKESFALALGYVLREVFVVQVS
jgi:hypothetical protein